MLKKHHYKALPLSDADLMLVARAGKTPQEVLASGEAALAALGLGAEEIGVVATAAEADRVWAAASTWTTQHAGIALAEDRALATKTVGGSRNAVRGELPMAEGRHWAEFVVVKTMGYTYVGVVPEESGGKVAGLTGGWCREPVEHMWEAADGEHRQGGGYSEYGKGKAGYKQGDVVGLLLDLDAGFLTAYQDGGRLGVMAPNAEVKELGPGPFCWALDLMMDGVAVRIARGVPPTTAAEEATLAGSGAGCCCGGKGV